MENTYPFEFFLDIDKSYKSEDGKKWIIEGWAAKTGPDRNSPKIIITEEALMRSEKDLLTNSTAFYEHNRLEPVGKVVKSEFKSDGLRVAIEISKTAKRVWQLIKERVLNGLSIGGRIIKKIEEVNQTTQEVWYKVLGMEILEVSVVGLPANVNTRIDTVIEKSLKVGGEKIMDKTPEQIAQEKAEEERIQKELIEKKAQEDADFSKKIDDEIDAIKEEIVGETEEVVIKAAKKKGEKYPAPGYYLDKSSVISELKAILKMKPEEMANGIKALIKQIQSGKVSYYYQKSESTEPENKQVDISNLVTKEDYSKGVQEIETKLLTEDKVKEILASELAKLPNIDELKKSFLKQVDEDKEKEIKEAFENLPVEERMKLTLEKSEGKK